MPFPVLDELPVGNDDDGVNGISDSTRLDSISVFFFSLRYKNVKSSSSEGNHFMQQVCLTQEVRGSQATNI